MVKKLNVKKPARRRWWVIAIIAFAAILLVGIWLLSNQQPVSAEAPEAQKILDVQSKMPFQIMIPAYLPRSFDRGGVQIDVNQTGPSSEPQVQLIYRTNTQATLFIKEWLPGNPTLETLANSRPIQTKWGKGWMLTESDVLVALWVDIGPTRVSLYTTRPREITRELILTIAETLGPPSNNQVFYFDLSAQVIKDMPPPAPIEVQANAAGIQEFTLVITPGGYDPIRFAVKTGIPVRMHFRQLGQVGCGNTLIFPADPPNYTTLQLKSESDEQVLEFTPGQPGEYQFTCGHQMYFGVMTVRP